MRADSRISPTTRKFPDNSTATPKTKMTTETRSFTGYKAIVAMDGESYGDEISDADAEGIASRLAKMVRGRFPGIAIEYSDLLGCCNRRNVVGPDNEVADQIGQWIHSNWTRAV